MQLGTLNEIKKNFCADDINAHLRGKITFIIYGQNSKLANYLKSDE